MNLSPQAMQSAAKAIAITHVRNWLDLCETLAEVEHVRSDLENEVESREEEIESEED